MDHYFDSYFWTHPRMTRGGPHECRPESYLSCKNAAVLELPRHVPAASRPWRRAVPSSRTRPRRRVEARWTDQAATPKRRPIERHAQQYGRRPLSRAAAWWCVARTPWAASVEPLEEPVRAVDGSRSPRRRERLRERVQEATGGAGRLGSAKKWPGRLAPPVWWGQVGSGINPAF